MKNLKIAQWKTPTNNSELWTKNREQSDRKLRERERKIEIDTERAIQ